MTSISAQGRRCDSVLDNASSDTVLPPSTSAVVITRLTLHASPMIDAACAFSPAAATITTRSALLTSSIRSLVRPARSNSQPAKLSPWRGVLPNADAVKNVALFHWRCASSLTTRSLGASSAITLAERGLEFGASMRNRASAALDMRADSLCISILAPVVRQLAPLSLLPPPLAGEGLGGGSHNRSPPPTASRS